MSKTEHTALTAAMVRELEALAKTGEARDLWDYGANALSLHARARVLDALERRHLVSLGNDGYAITDLGRAAIASTKGE
jgi:predicted methyltransferase